MSTSQKELQVPYYLLMLKLILTIALYPALPKFIHRDQIIISMEVRVPFLISNL